MQKHRTVMLVILDGWGWREDPTDNAVRQAHTPTFDELWRSCPHAFLRTSGRDVGLPDGQMGNSEVGHLNIGAGRVVMQDLPRINDATRDGSMAEAPALKRLIEALKQTGGACHLLGLVSPGGVHAHQDHAAALAGLLTEAGVPTLMHAITDGRDTPPRSSPEYIERLREAMPRTVAIATVSGRYYAMDRDKRWERVGQAYRAIAEAEGPRFPDAQATIAHAHDNGDSDEFIVPAVIGDYRGMRDGDGLLCFNFRADRTRQILTALVDPSFAAFPRERALRFAAAVGMTQYSAELDEFLGMLSPPLSLETPYPGQDSILVQSPKVATYDLQPEMSAPELTDRAVAAIKTGRYDLIILNYANPDMVGHTGSLPAAIEAVETVDTGLGRIAEAVREAGGAVLVTADHGNCELMRDPDTGEPHTAHTTNPVPALLQNGRGATLANGRLADIAPTLLELMGLPKPPEMTGTSLLRRPGNPDATSPT
jgi:2,3-bisphosphoglycerate-independent phosphoglycerate mutase